MRRLFIPLICLTIAISGCDTRSEQAADYNDQIIDMQVSIIDHFNDLDSAKVNYADVEKMELAHVELVAEIRRNLSTLKEMNGFKGDEQFLGASIKMFDTYKDITERDYAELIKLLSQPDSLFTLNDQQRVADLQDTVAELFDKAHDEFTTQQRQFGEKYNVEFEIYNPE